MPPLARGLLSIKAVYLGLPIAQVVGVWKLAVYIQRVGIHHPNRGESPCC